MGIKQELGQKIKRMRTSRGLTQEQLAEMVDVSQRTMSGIEIGENFLTAETLDKIIRALNTTGEELFSTDHIKEPKELIAEIYKDIEYFSKNPEKLETVYKLIKALKKE